MNREDYIKTSDYKKALGVVRSFTYDALNGCINNLKNEDITLLIDKIENKNTKNLYFGNINDPDMYYITQAIYIVVWGHIFDLTFDKMGSWGKIKHPFRGDTMNSFNSVFGRDMMIAKRYEVEDVLIKTIKEFACLYHSIGNFIVLPNKLNINSMRANYYTMQDYFDSFVGALYQYKHPNEETVYKSFCDQLNDAFAENKIFNEISFDKYVDYFFLRDYVKEGKPFNVFSIEFDIRKKEYKGRLRRSKILHITKEEYISLASNYLETAEKIIRNRADSIIDILNNALNNDINCNK